MPAFSAHHFFSTDVLKKLDDETRERLEKYYTYYKLGAQGPEIYFYYKPYRVNTINTYGKELHDSNFKKLVEDAVVRIKEYDDEGALVYLLGVATHFTLDNATHKLINAAAKDYNEHLLIETDFEHSVLTKKLVHNKPHTFRRSFMITYPGGKRKGFGSQMNLVFPMVDVIRSNDVVYQFEMYLGHLHSPKKIKQKIVKFFSNKFSKTGNDYSLMIVNEEPTHLYDDLVAQLDEKYEEAIDYAVANVMNIIDHYDNGAKLSHHLSRTFYK